MPSITIFLYKLSLVTFQLDAIQTLNGCTLEKEESVHYREVSLWWGMGEDKIFLETGMHFSGHYYCEEVAVKRG